MLYLGSDHRGFELKDKVKDWLKEWGYEYCDLGAELYDPEDDYPTYGFRVAEKVADSKENRGIVVCGSGVGVDIAANRIAGVRCGLCFSVEQVAAARQEDDINCLAMSADYLTETTVREIVKAFLEREFTGEAKYLRRIHKLA